MKWNGNIEHFVVTGDIHGNTQDIDLFCKNYDVSKNALIILGDVGLNYYLNKTDRKNKEYVQGLGCLVYCGRGNHEARPESLPDIKEEYDDIIDGYVLYEEQYPNIRYLKDGGIYNFGGYTGLVIGGAYSVDKHYRLARARANGWDPETHWTGWFKDEQLSAQEMFDIQNNVHDMTFDFVLTHTCPYSWQPFDLFLAGVDQSTVDSSMERWFDTLKEEIHWNCAWLFGHFHDDRMVRPHVEMYMNKYDTLDTIAQRWKDWDNGYRLDWWLRLDPCWPFWDDERAKRVEKPTTQTKYEQIWFHDADVDDDDDDNSEDDIYNL